jgi:hypothetical protein
MIANGFSQQLQPARAGRRCSAPFEKGGYGGFAFDFDLALDRAPEQKQIPLNPPFSKGEAGLRAAEMGLVTS